MFRLAYNQAPPKVAGVPYVPMLEEDNVRSGFFTREEYLSVRGALPDYAQIAVTMAFHTGRLRSDSEAGEMLDSYPIPLGKNNRPAVC
jgi:hypothetical protein